MIRPRTYECDVPAVIAGDVGYTMTNVEYPFRLVRVEVEGDTRALATALFNGQYCVWSAGGERVRLMEDFAAASEADWRAIFAIAPAGARAVHPGAQLHLALKAGVIGTEPGKVRFIGEELVEP